MIRVPTPATIRKIAAGAVMAMLLLGGPIPLVAGSRTAGDLRAARAATEQLYVIRGSVPLEGDSIPLQSALRSTSTAVDTFLISSARDRLPRLYDHIDRGWWAYETAEQIWRASDEGTTSVPVSAVYGAERLIEEAPELNALIVDAQGVRAFDNTELKSVKALFEYAKQEEESAMALVRAGIEEER